MAVVYFVFGEFAKYPDLQIPEAIITLNYRRNIVIYTMFSHATRLSI